MKKEYERLQSIRLRKQGRSLNYIAKELGVSKGSVSAWVRDVNISNSHKELLNSRPMSRGAVQKRRLSRLKSEKKKRDKIIQDAEKQVGSLSNHDLWLLGVSLYWAEGGKTQRMVRFSNGDPYTIQLMMKFFIEVCGVEKKNLKGYIHIHEHLDVEGAELYWQGVTGLPKGQFYKTYRKKRTKSKRKTLPYGVMDLYVLDVELFLKIQGWISGISRQMC